MSVKELSEAAFDEAINTDKVVVVDFHAEWCGPCKTLKPVLEEVSAEGHTIYSINVDDNKDLASKHQISSIPTVLFFKNGKQVDQFVGVKEKEDIIALITKNS